MKIKVNSKPGDMFNAHKSKITKKKEHSTQAIAGIKKFVAEEAKEKTKKMKKSGLRSADAVVKSEQNASHQMYKKHKKSATIKKTGTFKGKSNKLGGGGRFAQVAAKAGGGAKGAAIAAAVGRKALGKKKFQELATKGRKRSMKKTTSACKTKATKK